MNIYYKKIKVIYEAVTTFHLTCKLANKCWKWGIGTVRLPELLAAECGLSSFNCSYILLYLTMPMIMQTQIINIKIRFKGFARFVIFIFFFVFCYSGGRYISSCRKSGSSRKKKGETIYIYYLFSTLFVFGWKLKFMYSSLYFVGVCLYPLYTSICSAFS